MTMLEKICLRSEKKRGTTRPEYFAAIKAQRIRERAARAFDNTTNITAVICGLALLWVVVSFFSWQFGIGGDWNFFDLFLELLHKYGKGA